MAGIPVSLSHGRKCGPIARKSMSQHRSSVGKKRTFHHPSPEIHFRGESRSGWMATGEKVTGEALFSNQLFPDVDPDV
jgi:hypothetical protein